MYGFDQVKNKTYQKPEKQPAGIGQVFSYKQLNEFFTAIIFVMLKVKAKSYTGFHLWNFVKNLWI